MKLTDNKALNILIIVNVFALVAIFLLLWMLWKNSSSTPVAASGLNDSGFVASQERTEKNKALLSGGKREMESKKTLTMSEKVNIEVGKTERLLKNEVKKQVSNFEVNTVTSLDEISDIQYVVEYEKIKNEIQPKRNISNKDVTTVKVIENAGTSTEVKQNKFNNIDVSGLKNRKEMFDTITARISSLMLENQDKVDSNSKKSKESNNYLSAIKSAEVERKNEMRIIKVKAGESLWEIAVRAYGNGFLYKKIYKANPQLTNPNLIVVGQTLRVPL